jgi:hypothetical protein
VLEIILKIFALGGPPALAVMGFVVIDKLPKSVLERVLWYAAFFLIAFISVGAAIFDSFAQDRKITAMLMGDPDNFPQLFGLLKPDAKGRLPLYLTNARGSPLFDVTFSIMHAGKFEAIAARNWGSLLPGAYDTGIWIEPGHYQINIVARNGFFVEMYILGVCKGQIAQYIRINMPLRGGKELVSPNIDRDCIKSLGGPLPPDQSPPPLPPDQSPPPKPEKNIQSSWGQIDWRYWPLIP